MKWSESKDFLGRKEVFSFSKSFKGVVFVLPKDALGAFFNFLQHRAKQRNIVN